MTGAAVGAVLIAVTLVCLAVASRRHVVREVVATLLFVTFLSLGTCGLHAASRGVISRAVREGSGSEEFHRGVLTSFESLTGLQVLLVVLGSGLFVLSVWRRDER